MEKARNQLDEVTGLMRGNMMKIMERDHMLNNLGMRVEVLLSFLTPDIFFSTTSRVTRIQILGKKGSKCC